MHFKKLYSVFILMTFIFVNQASSQSLGIIFEASSFNLQDFYYNDYSSPSGLIKNLFINYNEPIGSSFILSIRAGYGWNRYSFSHYDGKDLHERATDGMPFEAEVKYNHFIGTDSVFAPLIGVGLGYYIYESKNKMSSSTLEFNTFENKFTSKGFTQYLVFGMNIHISRIISGSLQLKKIMINSISTEYTEGNDKIEKDYAQGNGLDDLSFSLGIFFNLQY
jgi:hypothetical protein